jgi:hypothetical protein
MGSTTALPAVTLISAATLARLRAALQAGLKLAKEEYEVAVLAHGSESLKAYYCAEQVEQMRQAVETVEIKLKVVK